MSPVSVLAVDDSALMRRYLREVLTPEAGFEVRTARNGEEALQEIRDHRPDVVTLDVNMPVMDGVTCLSRIMVEAPRPVVMVSSLTDQGALVTLEALELGAVDYIPKPDGTVSHRLPEITPLIREKVHGAARARVGPPDEGPPPGPAATPPEPIREPGEGLVVVGVSTGGPRALERILPRLPAGFPYPVVVAQHIGGAFTRLLAERLDASCELTVREAGGPTPLRPGEAVIGKGDRDLVVGQREGNPVAVPLPPDQERHLWHPSVDRLVWSALDLLPPERIIGVQLTGMGRDGVAAFTSLREQGGRIVAEAEETAVVFGMPRELIEEGGATAVRPLEEVPDQVLRWSRELHPCP